MYYRYQISIETNKYNKEIYTIIFKSDSDKHTRANISAMREYATTVIKTNGTTPDRSKHWLNGVYNKIIETDEDIVLVREGKARGTFKCRKDEVIEVDLDQYSKTITTKG